MPVRYPDDLTHTMTVPGNATITTDAIVPLVRVTRPGVVNSVEFLANAAQSGADTHSRRRFASTTVGQQEPVRHWWPRSH